MTPHRHKLIPISKRHAASILRGDRSQQRFDEPANRLRLWDHALLRRHDLRHPLVIGLVWLTPAARRHLPPITTLAGVGCSDVARRAVGLGAHEREGEIAGQAGTGGFGSGADSPHRRVDAWKIRLGSAQWMRTTPLCYQTRQGDRPLDGR
jgi:hypothetical protein